MKRFALLLVLILSMVSCRHSSRVEAGGEVVGDSVTSEKVAKTANHEVADKVVEGIVPRNTNLELYADSVTLEVLPIKDTYINLYKGARVVVAECDIHPIDSVDSLWVKVAYSQEIQGWISQKKLTESFVPIDSISQFIYLFSHTHLSYFIVVIALFVGVYLFRVARKKRIRMVYVNDIDSIYPLMLCLLMAIIATLYESIQMFAPDMWQAYYFNPTLSPFRTPLLLSAFLVGFWLTFIIALAAFDDLFSQLSSSEAFFYLLALLSACIFCYFFFILTTRYYIGYFFLAFFIWAFIRKARSMPRYKYRCGNCGEKIKAKGICLHCGAINK